MHQLVGIDDCERTLRHDNFVRGNPPYQKYGAPDNVASDNLATFIEACQKLEPFGCNRVADFFLQFARDARQICLVRLAVAPEQRKSPGIGNAWDVVAALEQVTARGVKDNCNRDVTIRHHVLSGCDGSSIDLIILESPHTLHSSTCIDEPAPRIVRAPEEFA